MEIAIIVLLVVLVVILGMLIFILLSMQRQSEALREQVNRQLGDMNKQLLERVYLERSRRARRIKGLVSLLSS